jgi:hypothetical protein
MADILMNYDKVEDMANKLGTAGDVINILDMVLTAISYLLIATGFGAAIGQNYLSNYKSKVKELADKCQELDGDLKESVQAYQRGDAMGATRFY